MRRKDRGIERAEVDKILFEGEFGVLSLNGGEGYPYGVPLNYVYTGESILFHGALEGEKLDRIGKDSKVSFCVVGNATVLPDKFATAYSSAIVRGRATIVEGDEKMDVLLALVDKYSPDYKEQGRAYAEKEISKTVCIRIDIDNITGKARK